MSWFGGGPYWLPVLTRLFWTNSKPNRLFNISRGRLRKKITLHWYDAWSSRRRPRKARHKMCTLTYTCIKNALSELFKADDSALNMRSIFFFFTRKFFLFLIWHVNLCNRMTASWRLAWIHLREFGSHGTAESNRTYQFQTFNPKKITGM